MLTIAAGVGENSLESQLKQIIPQYNFSNEEMIDSEAQKILRLSAFYPDIALKLNKRNQYLLPGGISAETQKESIQFVESLETILSYGSKSNFNLFSSSSAKALAFEELFDAGHTMIVKSSVIDPVFSILFADSVRFLHKTIFIDNWIRITSEDPDTLKVLLEIREIWKKLSRQSLLTGNKIFINQLKKLLKELSTLWDVQREIEIK